MRIVFLLTVLTLSTQLCFSQSSSSRAYRALADSLYQHHNYQHAAEYYQKALNNSSDAADIMLHIARCYNKLNNMTEANTWFKKADNSQAVFSKDDIIQYIQVLMMNLKRVDAEALLMEHLKSDPHSYFLKQMLDDIRDYEKYYRDSLAYEVMPLSINTRQSEFAPAFYKDGIVFSASKPRGFLQKKYHWDNSHFLNLYYSPKITNSKFKEPVLLEDKLNARFHDGPASFYSNDECMIITRNHNVPTPGKKNSSIWHLALFDGQHALGKTEWTLQLLPFNEQGASFAHPSISQDGTVLYFISDKPGGYGGTDIYKIVRTSGEWGKPFNLGPIINTPGNEVFPFFTNSTLYFSSNGHGGLGGLDIFSSSQTVNGFTKPINLGYPLNTHLDDFSFITSKDEQSGYFSSTRNGNDDLFTFNKRATLIELLAHIYDGKTKENLIGAEVQVITDAGHDTTLVSDDAGRVRFTLPRDAAFILIGTKDSKTGMLSDFANEKSNAMVHELAAFGDTTKIPCIVLIKDAFGDAAKPSAIKVEDDQGQLMETRGDHSMVSFVGEKGRSYKVEIKNEVGDATSDILNVAHDGAEQKTISLSLKEVPKNMDMAVKVIREKDSVPMARTQVKVVTFSEPDRDLATNENGIVEFSLPIGSAYMVIAAADNLTGVHSGVAETGADKYSIIHSLTVKGDLNKLVPMAILITDKNGVVLSDAMVEAVDKNTGENLPVEKKDGVFTFLAERENYYEIHVASDGYHTVITEMRLPADAIDIEKVNIALEAKKPYQMAARVFNAAGNSPLAGAQVKLITLDNEDVELIADSAGIVYFTLQEGTAYVAMATKDGLTGMHSGIVEHGTDKNTIIHPIAIQGDSGKQLPVVTFITNQEGETLNAAQVKVSEKISGEIVPSEFNEGILNFYGEKGKTYDVSVENEGHKPSTTSILISEEATSLEKINIEMEEETADRVVFFRMAARVLKAEDQSPLVGADVKLLTMDADDILLTTDSLGIINFTLADGTAYVAMATKDGLTGMHSGIAETGMDKRSVIHSIEIRGDSKNNVPVVTVLKNNQGEVVNEAHIKVVEKSSGGDVSSIFNKGILSFYGDKGKTYDVLVESKGEKLKRASVQIPEEGGNFEKIDVSLIEIESETILYSMAARVVNAADQSPLAQARVKLITFDAEDIDLVADTTGVIDFSMNEGTAYVAVASKDGLTGMHSGVVEPGTDKSSVVHTILVKGDLKNSVPVVGRLGAYDSEILKNTELRIIDEGDKRNVDFTRTRDVVTFMGEKGHSYTLEGITSKTTMRLKQIKVSQNENNPVQWRAELHDNSDNVERLVIFDNLPVANRYFLIRNKDNYEIIAENGDLYIQNDSLKTKWCVGSLSELETDAARFISDRGLLIDDIVRVENIYFDFDKATLDETDKNELDKVALLLQKASTYTVRVNTHADVRGNEKYNQRLSEKRATAIAGYLRNKNVSTTRLVLKAYGESLLAVPCPLSGCSEDDHLKNRRADFSIVISNKPLTSNGTR
jgi:outer membrane protein OmpA-like peptidoglycan-associated protein/NACalpha-BTF3-like transcription factor